MRTAFAFSVLLVLAVVGGVVAQTSACGRVTAPRSELRVWAATTPTEMEAGKGLIREREDYLRDWSNRVESALISPARAHYHIEASVPLAYDPRPGQFGAFVELPSPAGPSDAPGPVAPVASAGIASVPTAARKE